MASCEIGSLRGQIDLTFIEKLRMAMPDVEIRITARLNDISIDAFGKIHVLGEHLPGVVDKIMVHPDGSVDLIATKRNGEEYRLLRVGH